VVIVHSAGLQDAEGGKLTLQALFDRDKRSLYNRWCRLKLIWADGAYKAIVGYARQHFGWALEIVKREPGTKGFKVLPRRWVAERSFGWFGRYRRLARDYEHTVSSSVTFAQPAPESLNQMRFCTVQLGSGNLVGGGTARDKSSVGMAGGQYPAWDAGCIG
jgi:putative transposase